MTEHPLLKLSNDVRSTQEQLISLLEPLATDQDWQPDAENWSFRFIAAHLAAADKECFWERVTRIASGEKPWFDYYHNTGRDFSASELRRSLNEWKETRARILDFVNSLGEEQLALIGTHVRAGEITIKDVLESMLEHDEEHLEDLEKSLREYGSAMEAS